MEEPQEAIRLTAFEVHAAPAHAGIYAWYIEAPFGPEDWAVGDPGTLSHEGLTASLAQYADFYRSQPVSLVGRAAYGASWRGSLSLTGLNEALEDDDGAAALRASLADGPHRRILLELIRGAAPIFASPVYIGVAENLQKRLAQHTADYEKAHQFIQTNPSQRDTLRAQGKTLGSRLVGAGVPLERLSVWVMSARQDESLSPQGRRTAAEAAEWLLQRLFRPLYGRR